MSCTAVARSRVWAELGACRRCGHRWMRRFRAEGWNGLRERRSGPAPAGTAPPTPPRC
ncbi:leucine zipper domain-containing protein [Nonomuraea sp. ATR24]|uniref:leucine zipper domain-containing protein n=1 Tax=Nonomuraea TaxID=83681 RepID=UPI0035571826